MRTAAGILAVLVLIMAVGAGQARAATGPAPDLKPLISYFQTKIPNDHKVIVIGEEHGRAELRDMYPLLLRALRQSGSSLNCLYFELDSAFQPAIDDYYAGRSRALDVMPRGVKAAFEKWQLVGPNPYFNWTASMGATLRNLNLDHTTLREAKQRGFKVIAVDEQSRLDYLASIYQFIVEKYGGESTRPRQIMEKAGLLEELPPNNYIYFRDEIIFRRSRKMAERIVQSIATGECRGGLFVAGALHVRRQVPGGSRIYRQGGETAVDVLKAYGIGAHSIGTLIADPSSPRFAHASRQADGLAYFLLGPHNFEHDWNDRETHVTLLVRQYKAPSAK